jgi:hypothetical protein
MTQQTKLTAVHPEQPQEEGAPDTRTPCTYCNDGLCPGFCRYADQPQGEEAPTHHVWCNYATGPVTDCKQCQRLYAKYPWKPGEDSLALAALHFPDAIPLTAPHLQREPKAESREVNGNWTCRPITNELNNGNFIHPNELTAVQIMCVKGEDGQ